MKSAQLKRLLSLVMTVSIFVGTNAATFYVSPTGSDANSGSQTAPWATITHAVAAAASADTIMVQNGDYSASALHLSKPGQTIIGSSQSFLRQVYFETNKVTLRNFVIGSNHTGGWLDGAICRSLPGSDGSSMENCSIFSYVGKNQIGLNMAGNNFTCKNCDFTKFSLAQIVQFSGNSNRLVSCFIHDNPSPEAVFYIWGRYNRIGGCVVSNNFEAELVGAHPDLVQSFFAESWGHVLESNLFVNNSCQIGSLQSSDAGTKPYQNSPNAGGWIFRNNVFINSGSKLDVDFRDMQFLNNTFYNCDNNTAEGHVINFNYSPYGIGTNGVVINNIFALCGSDPSSKSQGWFGISEGTNTQNIIQKSMTIHNNFVVGNSFAPKDTNQLIGLNWLNGGSPKFLNATASRVHKLMLSGTTGANGTTNIIGNRTSFVTELAVGDRIMIGPSWTNPWVKVVAILNPTNLWVDVPVGTGVSLKTGGAQQIMRDQGHDPLPDLRLLAGSLAIDAGADLALVPADFNGQSRPLGDATDIGAFEGATPEVIPKDMVLHLTFDNWAGEAAALDSTANHCDALLFGSTPNWPTLSSGPNGGSAAHIGNNQYFGITNTGPLKNLTQGTVAVWAKRDNSSGVYSYILDCGFSYPATNGWTLGQDTGNPTKLYVTDTNFNRQAILIWNDFQETAWHHYAFTWSGSTCIGYYDGVAFQTNLMPAGVLTTDPAGWLAIGTMQHNGTPQWGDDPYPNAAFFNGSVADVRVYNTALSASELLNVYYVSASAKLPYNAPPPAGGTLPPQLLVHLTFAGWTGSTNVLDTTTNRANAIAFSSHGPTLAKGPFGTNAAAHFGVGQWLAITNTWVFEYLTNGTLSAWINFDNPVGSGDFYAVDGWYGFPNTNCFCLATPFGNTSQLRMFADSGTSQTLKFTDWNISRAWHQYAVSWNGASVVTFLDGKPLSTMSQTVPFFHVETTSHWLALGAQHGSHIADSPAGGWLQGSLADVRIYNYALTSSDMSKLIQFQEPPPRVIRPNPPDGLHVVGAN